MRNHFKTIIGSQSSSTLKQETFAFESNDPHDMRRAYDAARDYFNGRGAVSVHARTIGVPLHVPVIGELPSEMMTA